MPEATPVPKSVEELPDAFSSYEQGKHRRYNLLFTVNGGAFAVAKLFGEAEDRRVLGHLTLRQLSIGMILFTIVMGADIYYFGRNMKRYADVFRRPGKLVLISIGLLLASGWALVA